MATPLEQLRFTEAQYLEFERNADERHEFIDGHVFSMAGESGRHGDICTNLLISLGSQLKGSPCRARSKDTKVRSGAGRFSAQGFTGLYSYPDIVIICGEPKYPDKHRDVITNPKVIIEVLSDTTEKFDRTEKFLRYRMWNESLTDYILVAQDQRLIEHFHRRKKSEWVYTTWQEADQTISIKSIKCALPIADVYDRITFASTKPKSAKKKKAAKKAKKNAAKSRK
ncbi:MAG: Uma2 family endonuclease [Blastocatellia bacterium]